jgi:signal transduction histidine kinase
LARRAGSQLRAVAAESVFGTWDRVRIEQVANNLLSNAIKFGAGMPIDVSVEQRGAVAILQVRDYGEGMHQIDIERVLGRFERAVSHRRYGGLGLGLYIANEIVRAHGGSIEVTSQPGKGATFKVVLPAVPEGGG